MTDSASEVLQAYLLTLGWQTDEAAQKKMVAALDQVQDRIGSVAAAIEQMTSRMVLASRRAADSLADLYWASQKTTISAGYIRAFGFAVSQMGGSVSGATASIERFAEKLRSSPNGGGYWAMLKTMGVSARDAEGALKQLGKAFASMPYYRAKLYAEQLGIDEDTMRAMIRGVDRFADRYHEKMRQVGLDPQVAARNAAEFRNIWQDLWGTLSVIVDKIADQLLKAFGGEFKSLNEWLLAHADEIAKAVESILKFFVALVKELVAWIERSGGFEKVLTDMTDMFRKFGDSVGGVVKQVRALYDWLKKIGEDTGITWLLNKLGYYGSENSNPGTAGNGDGASGSGKDSIWWKADRYVRKKLGLPPAANDPIAGGRGGLGTRRAAGVSGGDESGRFGAAPASGPAGKYRPPYSLSDRDLSDQVVNTIAGEARMGAPGGVDAVINNMLNRVGSKGWGPSGDLQDVARAPGQYAGYRRATAAEAAHIRARIRAIASGGVPDNTNGSNSFRASSYGGPWMRNHGVRGVNVGGNVFAYQPGFPNGPYAPYKTPRSVAPVEAGMPGYVPHTGQVPPDLRGKKGLPLPGEKSPYGGLYPLEKFNAPPAPSTNSFTSSSIRIDQKNEFNVSGVSDPSAAAAEVEKRLNRTNAGLTRNLEGAAR